MKEINMNKTIVKENDMGGLPQISFDLAETTEPKNTLRLCSVCVKFKYNTILFVNSLTAPHTWNCICTECLNRLQTKLIS